MVPAPHRPAWGLPEPGQLPPCPAVHATTSPATRSWCRSRAACTAGRWRRLALRGAVPPKSLPASRGFAARFLEEMLCHGGSAALSSWQTAALGSLRRVANWLEMGSEQPSLGYIPVFWRSEDKAYISLCKMIDSS